MQPLGKIPFLGLLFPVGSSENFRQQMQQKKVKFVCIFIFIKKIQNQEVIEHTKGWNAEQ